jgi:hypothetical protein
VCACLPISTFLVDLLGQSLSCSRKVKNKLITLPTVIPGVRMVNSFRAEKRGESSICVSVLSAQILVSSSVSGAP